MLALPRLISLFENAVFYTFNFSKRNLNVYGNNLKKTIVWTPLYENNIYKSSYGALQNEKYEEEKKSPVRCILLLPPPAGKVFNAFVCLFLGGLCKNYSTDFHRIRWKGGMRAAEDTIRFWW